jgi:uncharacterized protein YggL (DUF469 family)
MKKKYNKDEIVKIVKTLYFEVDNENNRKYSIQKIEEILNKEYKIKISDTTIGRLVSSNGWKESFQSTKNEGQLKALKESKNIDKTIEDITSNVIADNYRKMIGLKNKAVKTLNSKFKSKSQREKMKVIELTNIIATVDTSLGKNPIEKKDEKITYKFVTNNNNIIKE